MFVKDVECARGKSIHVRLDLDQPSPRNYTVILAFYSAIYSVLPGLTMDQAEEWAEEQQEIPGPGGDASFLVVWDRVIGKEETFVPWEGSTLQEASRFFPIASWNWFTHLASARNILEKGKQV